MDIVRYINAINIFWKLKQYNFYVIRDSQVYIAWCDVRPKMRWKDFASGIDDN